MYPLKGEQQFKRKHIQVFITYIPGLTKHLRDSISKWIPIHNVGLFGEAGHIIA